MARSSKSPQQIECQFFWVTNLRPASPPQTMGKRRAERNPRFSNWVQSRGTPFPVLRSPPISGNQTRVLPMTVGQDPVPNQIGRGEGEDGVPSKKQEPERVQPE